MSQQQQEESMLTLNRWIYAIQVFNDRFRRNPQFREGVQAVLCSEHALCSVGMQGTEAEIEFLLECLQGIVAREKEMERLRDELSKEQAVRQILHSEYQLSHPGEPSEILAEKERLVESNHFDLLGNLRFEIFNQKFQLDEGVKREKALEEELRALSDQIDMMIENEAKERERLIGIEKMEQERLQGLLSNLQMQHSSLERIYKQSEAELKEVYLQLGTPESNLTADGIVTTLKRELRRLDEKYQLALAQNRNLLQNVFDPDNTSPENQAYLISKLKADLEWVKEEARRKEMDDGSEENKLLKMQVQELENELGTMKNKQSQLENEYQALLKSYSELTEESKSDQATSAPVEPSKSAQIEAVKSQILAFIDSTDSTDSAPKIQDLESQLQQKNQEIQQLKDQLEASNLSNVALKMEKMEISHKNEMESLKTQLKSIQCAQNLQYLQEFQHNLPRFAKVYDCDLGLVVDAPILPMGAGLSGEGAEPSGGAELNEEEEDSSSGTLSREDSEDDGCP